jgi:hypothetical protein
MRITNQQEAANTKLKLATLESHYDKACQREMDTTELQQLTLYSLRQSINQLKEELIRFECDVKAGRMEADAAV